MLHYSSIIDSREKKRVKNVGSLRIYENKNEKKYFRRNFVLLKPKGIVKKLATTSTVAGVMAIAPLAMHPGSASAHAPSAGLVPQSNNNSQATVVHKQTAQNTQTAQTQTSQKETSSQLLKSGDRGTAVSNLQSKLNAKGFLHGGIDGIYGPNTADAVRAFQNSNGLPVDGIAGPDTFAKLNGNSAANNNNSNSNNNSTSVNHSNTVQNNNTTVNNNSSNSNNVYHPVSASGSNHQSSNVEDMSYRPNQTSNNQSNQGDQNSQVSGSKIAAIAQQYNGAPYVWGGMSPAGFDCSGFIKYVLQQAGIETSGRDAAAIYSEGTSVSTPSVGDVVFFSNTYKPGISHAGIYIGNNQMIGALNEKDGVQIVSLDNPYWKSHLTGFKSYN